MRLPELSKIYNFHELRTGIRQKKIQHVSHNNYQKGDIPNYFCVSLLLYTQRDKKSTHWRHKGKQKKTANGASHSCSNEILSLSCARLIHRRGKKNNATHAHIKHATCSITKWFPNGGSVLFANVRSSHEKMKT